MKHIKKGIFIFIPLIIFLFSSKTIAAVKFPIATAPKSEVELIPIPVATITVDGNTSDWGSISPVASDPQGDSHPSYTGDDIKALYVAKDSTNLYIRMDLWENANTNFGNGPSPNEGSYKFEIFSNSSTYPLLEIGLSYTWCGQWSLGCNGSNYNAPSTLRGTSFVKVSGSVIEIKIPLSQIGNPTVFYSISAFVDNCCVADVIHLDKTGAELTKILGAEVAISAAFDGTNYLVALRETTIAGDIVTARFVSQFGELVGSKISIESNVDDREEPLVAFDGTNYLLVWNDDDNSNIMGQFIGTAGNLIGSPFVIASYYGQWIGFGGFVFGGGKYLVVYEKGPPEHENIIVYCRLVDPSGSVSEEIRVSTGYGTVHFPKQVAFDGTNFLIAWTDDTNDSEIRGRFISPSGTLGNEFSINASTYPSDNPLAVGFDGTNYLVVWADEVGGYGSYEWDLFGQLIDKSGNKVGPVITVSSAPGIQIAPTIVFDGINYLVVWNDTRNEINKNWYCDANEGTCWDIYGKHISKDGTRVGSEFIINNDSGNQIGGIGGFHNRKYIGLINNVDTIDDYLTVSDVYGIFIPIDYLKIAGGLSHTVALENDGTVWAWGDDTSGQLGDGSVIAFRSTSTGQLVGGVTTNSTTPVQVSGLTSIAALAAGLSHTIALESNGTVKAWGLNSSGQLGNGTNSNSDTPVQVTGLTNVIAVAAGGNHSLALKSNGTVWAWGLNSFGQLGDGTNNNSNTPVQVTGLTNVIAVAAGGNHSLALKSNGTVWAWGLNSFGQLGDGTNSNSNIPVQVTGLSNVVMIAGGDNHTLALKNDLTAWAWGLNSSGQLGNGTNNNSNIPVQVSGLNNAVMVAAGGNHSLALKDNLTAWAWGLNSSGQLGDGTTNNSNIPVQVSGLNNAVAIAAGGNHSIALLNDGTIRTWGDNSSGQLGDGTNNDSATAVEVTGFTVYAGQQSLTITKTGTGSGTVTSSPAGINCGSDCGESFTINPSAPLKIALTAIPDPGSTFKGWSGCVSTSNKCTVTMDGIKHVSARFMLPDLYGELSSMTLKASTTSYSLQAPLTLYAGPGNTADIYYDAYLSDDDVLDGEDTLITLLPLKFGKLKADLYKLKKLKFTLTGNPAGKYLIIVLDPDNLITEENEDNNTVIALIPDAPPIYSTANLSGTWNMHFIESGDAGEWGRGVLSVSTTGSANYISYEESNSYSVPSPATMTTASTGVVTIQGTNFNGILSKDKNLITGTWTDGGTQLGLFQKAGGSFASGDLAGTWIIHGLGSGESFAGWIYGSATIDSEGDATFEIIRSNDESSTLTSSASIDSNGVVVITGISTSHGVMSADKQLIVMTLTESDGTPDLLLMLKAGESYCTADLVGTWRIYFLSTGSGTAWTGWVYGSASITSSGTLKWSSAMRSDGSTTLPSPSVLSIAANGIMSMEENSSFHGMMSGDKNLMVFTSDNGSGGYNLGVAIRR